MKATNIASTRLLHRFYEPLTLLYVLDRTQGDPLRRAGAETSSLEDNSRQELRRRFLDSLSYICDFKKGGDTVTAIAIASGPLRYYMSCNKGPGDEVIRLVKLVLATLAFVYSQSAQQRTRTEKDLLAACSNFSEHRLTEYWQLLQLNLRKCRDSAKHDPSVVDSLAFIEQSFRDAYAAGFVDLCSCAKSFQQTPEFGIIKSRALSKADQGNTRSPFASLKHFIGRLAYHPRSVQILMVTACRLPELFLDPEIIVVQPQNRPLLLPPRRKSTLHDIVGRIVRSDDNTLASDLRHRLSALDKAFRIEEDLRKEYEDKKLKPRPHAELILLEHIYRDRELINLVDNDRYIGCSKPACYCCFLYIRSHPGHFVEPATHQNIYLNWLPPTYRTGIETTDSELAHHEKKMLIDMNQSVKDRLIEQIMSFGGRREKNFDSVSGDTMSARIPQNMPRQDSLPSKRPRNTQEDGGVAHVAEMEDELSTRFAQSSLITASDDDSELEGGVPLTFLDKQSARNRKSATKEPQCSRTCTSAVSMKDFS